MKSPRMVSYAWPIVSLGLAFIVGPSCKLKPRDGTDSRAQLVASADLSNVVAAHTAGTVSKQTLLQIRFVRDVVGEDQLNQALDEAPFSISPKAPGSWRWTSANTLSFAAAQDWQSGQTYKVSIDLTALDVPQAKESLVFEFGILEQAFVVGEPLLQADAAGNLSVSGVISTADVADVSAVERMLDAKHAGSSLEIVWQHPSAHQHRFEISGIQRKKKEPSLLTLKIHGNAIGVSDTQTVDVVIPGDGAFVLLAAQVDQAGGQHIALRFSQAVEPKQALESHIQVRGRSPLRMRTEGATVRIYSSVWSDEEEVSIGAALKSAAGHTLGTAQQRRLQFSRPLPAVRFAGDGVIFPTTHGLTIPIETKRLRAVIVEATQVFDENLPQFLQVNALDGERELARVGRVVWRQVVPLAGATVHRDDWRSFGLDMTPLLQRVGHGLYRIKLSFARPHIAFDCGDGSHDAPLDLQVPAMDDDWGATPEASHWDYYNNGDGVPYWEAYQNRKNPCHVGYYRDFHDHKPSVSRNVLVSDVGIIAKRYEGGVFVGATDLKTTAALSGAMVRVLDYQQQLLATGKTDAAGLLRLATARRPFVVQVEHGGFVNIVKLDDASSLSLSHFDTGGAALQRGLKGFFYGERGIWRPGDDIHLTFVLFDSMGGLPAEHPITFELLDPQGKNVERRTFQRASHDFHVIHTRTAVDAPTGNYVARVRVGGATFEEVLRVETVMPNRLKVELELEQPLLTASQESRAELAAQWLHGAIADGLEYIVDATFATRSTRFDGHAEYSFDDPSRHFEGGDAQIASGRLDDKGRASFAVATTAGRYAPGMLTAQLRTRIFEKSGAFSSDTLAVPFSPYKRYIGIRTPKGDAARGMLLTDTPHTVDIAAVAADGSPQDTEVELRLYKLSWRWWWEKSPERLIDFAGAAAYTPIESGIAKVRHGKGQWTFQVKYPSWGRYLLLAMDKQGRHRAGKIIYMDWPGWAGRGQRENPGGASVLSFGSDKSEYQVGEQVTLTIPMPKEGRALVSIESGSQVVQAGWLEAKEGEQRFTFDATAEMAPNVYAHVTLVQPHLNANNDVPIRSYGVVPLRVVNPRTKIQPRVSTQDVFEPESTVQVQVKEDSGRAMTYTLAIVDEGLLGLTRFSTPNPWKHFYQREALGVRTWDVYSMVAGAYGGAFERLLAIGGGDEEDGAGAEQSANRFPPMVRFAGPFTLNSGATNSHNIDIPQYIGAVRVMVVAGSDGAYGAADKTVPVRKPLMALATAPRVMGPSEQAALPVSVFAMEDDVRDVSVHIEAGGVLQVEGPNKQQLRFQKSGDKLALFAVRATEVGIGKVRVQAQSGKHKAVQTIELQVRHPAAPIAETFAAALEPTGEWHFKEPLFGIAGTRRAVLEVSRVPPMDLERRLDALVRYPHGCAEQTTSSAFPQLYVQRLLELPQDRLAQVQANVNEAIQRLRGMQSPVGGFAYWSGAPAVNDWSTSYVGHFLLEARDAGYNVPLSMLDSWKKYQQEQARRFEPEATRGREGLAQAYRLYTLALAGAAELSSMNRLREHKELDVSSRFRLAAAYALAGQKDAAKGLLRNAPINVQPYRELSGTFGSDVRDKAMILETLVLLEDWQQARTLAEDISNTLVSDMWLSTQSGAFALQAMARFAIGVRASESLALSYAHGGKEQQVTSDKPLLQVEIPVADQQKNFDLRLKNLGKGTAFARVVVYGVPEVAEEKASSSGLEMTVQYFDADGEVLNPSRLRQGQDFYTTIEVRNTGGRHLEQLALSHLVASGWEIDGLRARQSSEPFEYRDIRDDRVFTYFDLKPGERRRFTTHLAATYQGRFYAPMVNVEAMYDATVHARVPGQWVEVVAPGPVN